MGDVYVAFDGYVNTYTLAGEGSEDVFPVPRLFIHPSTTLDANSSRL